MLPAAGESTALARRPVSATAHDSESPPSASSSQSGAGGSDAGRRKDAGAAILQPDYDNVREQRLRMAFSPATASEEAIIVRGSAPGAGATARDGPERGKGRRGSRGAVVNTTAASAAEAAVAAVGPTLLAVVNELPPCGTALRYGLFAPSAADRAALDWRIKNAAGDDAWLVLPGRDQREKYLAKSIVSAKHRVQLIVQTWLARLPKRIIGLTLPSQNRQGQPVLLVRGDPLSKRFAIESLNSGRQIARVKRLRTFHSYGGNLVEVSEWDLKIHAAVDASLVVAITAFLEDLVVQLGK
jgi:hypothetical protein